MGDIQHNQKSLLNDNMQVDEQESDDVVTISVQVDVDPSGNIAVSTPPLEPTEQSIAIDNEFSATNFEGANDMIGSKENEKSYTTEDVNGEHVGSSHSKTIPSTEGVTTEYGNSNICIQTLRFVPEGVFRRSAELSCERSVAFCERSYSSISQQLEEIHFLEKAKYTWNRVNANHLKPVYHSIAAYTASTGLVSPQVMETIKTDVMPIVFSVAFFFIVLYIMIIRHRKPGKNSRKRRQSISRSEPSKGAARQDRGDYPTPQRGLPQQYSGLANQLDSRLDGRGQPIERTYYNRGDTNSPYPEQRYQQPHMQHPHQHPHQHQHQGNYPYQQQQQVGGPGGPGGYSTVTAASEQDAYSVASHFSSATNPNMNMAMNMNGGPNSHNQQPYEQQQQQQQLSSNMTSPEMASQRETVLVQALHSPAALIGWKILIADKGLGTVTGVAKSKLPGTRTKHQVRFDSGKVEMLHLKRSETKGKVPFKLLYKGGGVGIGGGGAY